MENISIRYAHNDTLLEKSQSILSLVKIMVTNNYDRLELLRILEADVTEYRKTIENRIKLMEEI